MTVLALDCGFRTGWCRSNGRCGTFDIRTYDDHGHALAAWHDWLDADLRDNHTTLVLVESAAFGRAKNADLTLSMIRMAHMLAWSHCVPRAELSANTVRARLCGKAKATDAQIRSAVNARGLFPNDEHQGDAAALLCVHLRIPPISEAA
jgi:Holliday junction resolvasome RuvABC endonuclease subunit